MKEFFKENKHMGVLMRFKNKIDGFAKNSDFERKRDQVMKYVINSMLTIPDEWDKYCQINIEWRGESLLEELSNGGDQFNKYFLDNLCSILFRFMFEYYLSKSGDFSKEFNSARAFIMDNIDGFDDHAREQIKYAINEMPISMFKQIVNGDGIESVKEFNLVYANARKMKDEWNSEIRKKEKEVEALKSSLAMYENAFNFVGLFQGFDELHKQKIEEKDGLLIWLRVLAILVLLPIFIELIVVLLNFNNMAAIKEAALISFIPSISFVFIIIYYFKIILANYRSLKAQLLQIELRKTLCRFIQHYSEYSSQMKKKDPESLVKFENIIFSGLVSDDAALPSTYDGVEQIANFIKSVKS